MLSHPPARRTHNVLPHRAHQKWLSFLDILIDKDQPEHVQKEARDNLKGGSCFALESCSAHRPCCRHKTFEKSDPCPLSKSRKAGRPKPRLSAVIGGPPKWQPTLPPPSTHSRKKPRSTTRSVQSDTLWHSPPSLPTNITPQQDAEIDRILSAFRLDAYAVLDLQPGIPDSDIKIQYRKTSLLIHPDKTTNPRAPDAFDRLKKAQTALLDEKERTHLDECIADARMLLIRAKKLDVDVDAEELASKEFRIEWRKKTVEVLVEAEVRKRRQLKAQMQEEGRERVKEEEVLAERKRKREHEVDWERTREERIGSWRDWKGKGGKSGGGGAGGGAGSGGVTEGKKKKKMKVLG